MKSKREIEKELWPYIKRVNNLSSQNDHDTYVRFQREFQKRIAEQLRKNPITVYDLMFRVDILAEDVVRLLSSEMPKKR